VETQIVVSHAPRVRSHDCPIAEAEFHQVAYFLISFTAEKFKTPFFILTDQVSSDKYG
jgi:hypothetical protein